ncbi:MAG TPA: adenylate/guanylate cyclase domain-containing protein [Thermoanaerobaculia bacterium]|nr:adenylate/guanylate cyclase domain-containing protein [Thermoanaerobaculia bacterium]
MATKRPDVDLNLLAGLDTKDPAHISDLEMLAGSPRTRARDLLEFLGPSSDAGYRSVVGLGGSNVETWANQRLALFFGDSDVQTRVRGLESEISALRNEISEKVQTLRDQTLDAQQKDAHIQDLEANLAQFESKQSLAHLLDRVEPDAQRKLLSSADFRALFERDQPCPAYVLSIDVRRSTELMLKARQPRLFAQFMTGLARQLRSIVISNYGVFDKFTGDGVLAFFPDFYSGVDAGLFALQAAEQAHTAFVAHYQQHKHCFVSILRDVGLGIGLDFGDVQVVQIATDLTVVGTPVVYACRMSGADAGRTYVNQPAYEQLAERYSAFCEFSATELDIKNEGATLAYAVRLNGRPYTTSVPGWRDMPTATA